jgi:hypothetical protein
MPSSELSEKLRRSKVKINKCDSIEWKRKDHKNKYGRRRIYELTSSSSEYNFGTINIYLVEEILDSIIKRGTYLIRLVGCSSD